MTQAGGGKLLQHRGIIMHRFRTDNDPATGRGQQARQFAFRLTIEVRDEVAGCLLVNLVGGKPPKPRIDHSCADPTNDLGNLGSRDTHCNSSR